jgi:hypothetical protein
MLSKADVCQVHARIIKYFAQILPLKFLSIAANSYARFQQTGRLKRTPSVGIEWQNNLTTDHRKR